MYYAAVLHLIFAAPGGAGPLQHSPLVAVATLFVAGLATSLTPCIYPMIPITAGVIAGSAGAGPRARVVGLTLTYAVGLALVYAVLGLIAGLSGTLFGTVASSPWAMLIVGNLLLLFALAMWDVIPVRVPAGLMRWAGRLGGGSYPAVFLLGASSGVVAAPCGAPVFATILTWVAAERSGALGFLYLFSFSLGMTAILVLVGIFSGAVTVLPRSGAWLTWVKRIGGVVLVGVAEYYFVQVGRGL